MEDSKISILFIDNNMLNGWTVYIIKVLSNLIFTQLHHFIQRMFTLFNAIGRLVLVVYSCCIVLWRRFSIPPF